jgi:hypothetical protein
VLLSLRSTATQAVFEATDSGIGIMPEDLPHLGPHSHSEGLLSVFLILNSASLALLGPGGYSVDARMFGRRVMVVRPKRPE